MRCTILALAVFLAAIPGLAGVRGQDGPGAVRENRVVEEEYALAKSPNFYFMMNLGTRAIELKARGFALRSWMPQRIRYWGTPVAFRTLALARKTALTLPQRRVIKPGEPETVFTKPGQFELEALEVKDMPPSYTLKLEDGTRIVVLPRRKSLAGFWHDVKWYVGLPLKTLKLGRKKQTMSLIEISFDDPKEGQAMYWALTEGLKGLVWVPRSN